MPAKPICLVFKRKRRVNGRLRVASAYTLRVGLAGQTPQSRSSGVTDKRVAEQMAREWLEEMEQERSGLILPRSVREGVQRPLLDHLPDFIADLRIRGRNSDHIYTVEKRLRRLFHLCQWKWIRDVSQGSFDAWRRGQSTASAKTLNDYLALAKQFFIWLKRQGRSAGNPLEYAEKVTVAGRSQTRAAFSLDEQQRLLAVSGERAAVYLLALRTGLRRGEIDQLRWADVSLQSKPPTVRIRASVSKNRRQTDIPLCDDIAEVLTQMYKANPISSSLVFARGCPEMDEFRSDLVAADIPESDPLQRRRDFHSLRVTAITNVKAAGVSPAVAQLFARHSDSRLTESVYTDAKLLPTADVVRVLPEYKIGSDIAAMAAQFHLGGWTRELTTKRDASGRFVSHRDETTANADESQRLVNQGISRNQSRSVAAGRGFIESSPIGTGSNRRIRAAKGVLDGRSLVNRPRLV